jgi:hypothetical protein
MVKIIAYIASCLTVFDLLHNFDLLSLREQWLTAIASCALFSGGISAAMED